MPSKAALLADDVQDDWDAVSEEEPKAIIEAVVVPKKDSNAGPGVTKRELKRLQQVQRESEEIFGLAQTNHDEQEGLDELEAERAVRLGDLQSGMNLLKLSLDENQQSKIVESTMLKKSKPTASSAPVVLTNRIATHPLASQKDVDDLVKIVSGKEGLASHTLSRFYPAFLESLFRELAGARDVPEIRKLAGILTDLTTSKHKAVQQKEGKTKPSIQTGPKKGKGVDMDEYYDDGDVY